MSVVPSCFNMINVCCAFVAKLECGTSADENIVACIFFYRLKKKQFFEKKCRTLQHLCGETEKNISAKEFAQYYLYF
jgi:hypothetical protein